MYAGILLTTLVVILMAISVTKLLASEDGIPVLVNRRPSGDTFQPFNEILSVCSDDHNVTYLVSERRCVNNQELFSDCGFALVPGTERSKFRLAASITDQNGNRLEQLDTLDIDNSTLTNASVIAINNTDQPVSSSLCHIASLEVYRGRRQITEISHDGFSLSERGQVQIDQTELAYQFSEYKGELFRMNLSCSGVGLPGSGCLFFKVIGQANVTNAKFNMSIKGTLDINHYFTESTATKMSTSSEWFHSTTTASAISIPGTTIENLPDSYSSSLIYAIVGTGSGIIILIFIIIIITIITIILNVHFGRNKSLSRIISTSEIGHEQNRANYNSSSEEVPRVEMLLVPNQRLPDVTQSTNESSNNSEETSQSASAKMSHQNPVYANLDAIDSTSTSTPPELPIRCKQNRAYIDLGAKQSSRVAIASIEPTRHTCDIPCKQNSAYIHLEPAEATP